jgi:hypothetical protein
MTKQELRERRILEPGKICLDKPKSVMPRGS